MEKKKKKGGVVSSVIVAVLFYACGILLTVVNISDLFTPAKDIMDIIEDDGELKDGQYVTVGIDAVVDWYAETKHTVNLIPVGKEQHCIAWLEDGSFISLTVKKSYYDEIDDLIDKTWEFLEDESNTAELPRPIVFKGRISKMKSEVIRYYNESLSSMGIDRDENTVYDFTIDTTQSKLSQWAWIAACMIIGTLFVILAVRTGRINKKSENTGYAGGDSPDQGGYTGQDYTYQSGYRTPGENPYQNPYNPSENNNYNNPGDGL